MALIDMVNSYQELLEKKGVSGRRNQKQQCKDRGIKTGYRATDDR